MKKLVTRRWGYYKVLDFGTDYVLKELVIYPNRGISYQRHFERGEYWRIRSGVATIKHEGIVTQRKLGTTFEVPPLLWHQVWNTEEENLVILELQHGNCSEDDIERLEYYDGER